QLLPGSNRLQAALLIQVPDEARLAEALRPWQTLAGDELRLRLGEGSIPANLITCRPEDRCIGAAHWVQFVLDPAARKLLGDFGVSAWVEVQHGTYQHQSPLLSDDIRDSLLEDLELSDRDDPRADPGR